jgi:hypothetical protein
MAKGKQLELPITKQYQLNFDPLSVTTAEVAFVLNALGIQLSDDLYTKLSDRAKKYFVEVT